MDGWDAPAICSIWALFPSDCPLEWRTLLLSPTGHLAHILLLQKRDPRPKAHSWSGPSWGWTGHPTGCPPVPSPTLLPSLPAAERAGVPAVMATWVWRGWLSTSNTLRTLSAWHFLHLQNMDYHKLSRVTLKTARDKPARVWPVTDARCYLPLPFTVNAHASNKNGNSSHLLNACSMPETGLSTLHAVAHLFLFL